MDTRNIPRSPESVVDYVLVTNVMSMATAFRVPATEVVQDVNNARKVTTGRTKARYPMTVFHVIDVLKEHHSEYSVFFC